MQHASCLRSWRTPLQVGRTVACGETNRRAWSWSQGAHRQGMLGFSETSSARPLPFPSLRWVKRDHSDPSLPLKAPPKRSTQKGSYFLWHKERITDFSRRTSTLGAKLEPGVEQVRVGAVLLSRNFRRAGSQRATVLRLCLLGLVSALRGMHVFT